VPPRLHGPYWQWTAKVAGRTVTRRLSDAEAARYTEWIANDRRLRRTMAQMREVLPGRPERSSWRPIRPGAQPRERWGHGRPSSLNCKLSLGTHLIWWTAALNALDRCAPPSFTTRSPNLPMSHLWWGQLQRPRMPSR
jgi:hypothetical protein